MNANANEKSKSQKELERESVISLLGLKITQAMSEVIQSEEGLTPAEAIIALNRQIEKMARTQHEEDLSEGVFENEE